MNRGTNHNLLALSSVLNPRGVTSVFSKHQERRGIRHHGCVVRRWRAGHAKFHPHGSVWLPAGSSFGETGAFQMGPGCWEPGPRTAEATPGSIGRKR